MRLGAAMVVVGALALAPAASARIVPQRSIAGVAIDMTKAKVRDSAGAPLTRRTKGEFTFWTYPHNVEVAFRSGNLVTSVVTTGRFHRTASGLGVGTKRKALRAGLMGESCNAADCFLGNLAPGTVFTDFSFGTTPGGKKVRSVSIVRQR